MAKSPHLEKDRLADVMAAIQILGVSDRSSGTLNRRVAEIRTARGPAVLLKYPAP